jgi:hypothetical protein
VGDIFRVSGRVIGTVSRGKIYPVVTEADFYSAEEAAKALGIPVRRVFGMLCGGELEGTQDEWARWRVPASAVQRARHNPEPSYNPGEPSKDDAESRVVADEAGVGEATTTTVPSDGRPLWKPSSGAVLSSDEEITQEVGEAPVGGSPALHARTKGSDAETTERLPYGHYQEAAVPDLDSEEIIRELTERLAAAVAENKELRARLELAKVTDSALRESFERERQRADHESARAERKHTAAEQPEEV